MRIPRFTGLPSGLPVRLFASKVSILLRFFLFLMTIAPSYQEMTPVRLRTPAQANRARSGTMRFQGRRAAALFSPATVRAARGGNSMISI